MPKPLPTMSLRAAPEHHSVLRRIARVIRAHPEIIPDIESILDGAETRDGGATRSGPDRIADVLLRVEETETVLQDALRRITDMETERLQYGRDTERNTDEAAPDVSRNATRPATPGAECTDLANAIRGRMRDEGPSVAAAERA